MGTCDLGTRDEGLEDIKYGTRGRVGRGRGDVKYRDAGGRGMCIIIAKVGGKCDISVLFMVNIRFHLPKPHWTPYDAYTKYFFIILNLFGIECCYST